MPENDQNPPANDQPKTTPPDTGTVDVAALTEDRDKWKHFARVHEDKWTALSAENEALKASQMSDAEKAIEAARAEGRALAAAEFGTQLTAAELSARAAKAGVSLPDTSFINLAAFTGDGGKPNGDAIDAFIGTLPAAGKPPFSPDVLNNAGNRQANKPAQLTRSDLQRMSPEEVDAARKAGQLNDLLGIQ
jgi:hypothetical protein